MADPIDNVTLEKINEIFLDSSVEYEHIKEIAKKDVAKEIIDRIESFLEDRKKTKPEELKKIIFEDASKVAQEDINDIMDAFVRVRSDDTLDDIDKKSLDDVLILFNEWISVGKDKQKAGELQEVFAPLENEKSRQTQLEEQVAALRETMPRFEQLYQDKSFRPVPVGELYGPDHKSMYANDAGEFRAGNAEREHNAFYSNKATYKHM